MNKRNIILIIAEILVMGGILTAFIAPLLFPSEEPTEVGLKTLPTRHGDSVSS